MGPYAISPFYPTWVDAWVVQDPAVPFPLPHEDLPGPSQSAHGSDADGSFAANHWTAGKAGWKSGNLKKALHWGLRSWLCATAQGIMSSIGGLT